jgi:hypothetical protein
LDGGGTRSAAAQLMSNQGDFVHVKLATQSSWLAMEESSDDVISSAIDALVAHYRQPIHLEELSTQEPATSRDHLEESPLNLRSSPPVIRYQLERINKFPTSTTRKQLIAAYRTSIRPTFLSTSLRKLEKKKVVLEGIPVLIHYELLVALYSQQDKYDHEELNGDDFSRVLDETLVTLACDVTILTASIDTEEEKKTLTPPTLSNVVLPTLLRLMIYVIECAKERSAPLSISVLRRCVVTVLAFGCPKMGPQHIDPQIQEALFDLSKYVSFPPPTKLDLSLFKRPDSAVTADWFSDIVSDGTCWDDPDSEVASRTADKVWKSLSEYLAPAKSSLIVVVEEEEDGGDEQGAVLGLLDTEKTVRDVRAHFFGRDMLPEDAAIVAPARPRLHLGHAVMESPKVEDVTDKIFRATPARRHATLRFIMLLQDLNRVMLEELLPVCYELFASSLDAEIGLGAASLYHLLQCDAADNAWLLHADNLLTVLDETVKIVRDGPSLSLIGLAQRTLLQRLLRVSNPTHHAIYEQKRRQATQKWLLILDRNHTNRELAWGLLVGGIVPLLFDHARAGNADVLELGRLGLTALLFVLEESSYPVLQTESGVPSEFLHLAALAALLNLLVASHPIMPRHAGKILCVLLASIRHHMESKNDKMPSLQEQLARHVAAMAIVVCGDAALVVLNRIAPPNPNVECEYDDEMMQLVSELRQQADELGTYDTTCIDKKQ